MAVIKVKCPKCEKVNVIKHGLNIRGKQKYYCKDCKKIFLLEYKNNACKPETKNTIIKMTANASGVRDISRVLGISTDTVIKVLKKQNLQ